MRYVIENEEMKVEVESHGAELKSMKNKQTDLDYMWCANPEYYGKTSPNLFPIVGSLHDKTYRYNGQAYEMGQHGFARDMEWQAKQHSAVEVSFHLTSTPETLKIYPFAFAITINYQLQGKELKITWEITNQDEKVMHYSFGGHPCFTCPIHSEESSKAGYGYDFHTDTDIVYYKNDRDSGLLIEKEELLVLNNGRVEFTPDFFDYHTYIITGGQTHQISIFEPSGENYLTVSFDAPMVALWSAEGKNAPYVAIEPWYGHCDVVGYEGTLEERSGSNKLSPNQTMTSSYSIAAH